MALICESRGGTGSRARGDRCVRIEGEVGPVTDRLVQDAGRLLLVEPATGEVVTDDQLAATIRLRPAGTGPGAAGTTRSVAPSGPATGREPPPTNRARDTSPDKTGASGSR